ncbi:DNA polymerase Y family protein [Parasporobacterium paucivorans]|uniref:DNA polymerase-4 n=1 Tax=Parasporobacterium paucivorans DSM 15970 TaxID=1122934 RepID=A0A1M6KDC0_9FIRM|nr:hypothetical protein [Parasporobacterium paucivorans]SHJ56911.1 DNA polymerase-4 [Parasporobacterium paucivorans DSM 15970]
MNDNVIFHIDVNSAFLSWEACRRLYILGDGLDLRTIPSAVGGSQESRHGIILAKSIPAKAYKIQTGESLLSARKKCPGLVVVPPDYSLYVEASKAFIRILREFSPCVEQYSIDEAFCDMTGTHRLYGTPVSAAHCLKDRIHRELGFTVNIGVSTNKLLAKMAGDFKKPDMVHSLFPEEVSSKLWPLNVGDLFFVGRATQKKLYGLGITTIGELARSDLKMLRYHFKSHGEVIYNFANGIDSSQLYDIPSANKGYGNSLTLAKDVTSRDIAHMILLSLTETVASRLRTDEARASCISVSITDWNFSRTSHQRNILSSTNITAEIHSVACGLFDELWDNTTPIRQLGIQTGRIRQGPCRQYNLFDMHKYDRLEKLDGAVDEIRRRYGEDSIKRACFAGNRTPHMSGGLDRARRTGITKPVS